MITENIYNKAKTRLSRLIELVLEGEDVVKAKAGKPLVRIVPYSPPPIPVVYGLLKDKIVIAEDFNEYSPGDEECRS